MEGVQTTYCTPRFRPKQASSSAGMTQHAYRVATLSDRLHYHAYTFLKKIKNKIKNLRVCDVVRQSKKKVKKLPVIEPRAGGCQCELAARS